MKRPSVTFELRVTFESTRDGEIIPAFDTERAFLEALRPALASFVEGRGLELTRDTLFTKFGGRR